jgi:hypothetical protein
LWSIAVTDPKIQITVMVPIGDGHASSIIGQIEATDSRNVGKPCLAGIQKATVSFVAAK